MQFRNSGSDSFRQDKIKNKISTYFYVTHVTPREEPIMTLGTKFPQFCKGPLDNSLQQISEVSAIWFLTKKTFEVKTLILYVYFKHLTPGEGPKITKWTKL